MTYLFSRIRSSKTFLLIICLLCTAVFAGAPAHALAAKKAFSLTPLRVIHTARGDIKIYDSAKVRALPHATTRVEKVLSKRLLVRHTSSQNTAHGGLQPQSIPGVEDYDLELDPSIYISDVIQDGYSYFVCQYGLVIAKGVVVLDGQIVTDNGYQQADTTRARAQLFFDGQGMGKFYSSDPPTPNNGPSATAVTDCIAGPDGTTVQLEFAGYAIWTQLAIEDLVPLPGTDAPLTDPMTQPSSDPQPI